MSREAAARRAMAAENPALTNVFFWDEATAFAAEFTYLNSLPSNLRPSKLYGDYLAKFAVDPLGTMEDLCQYYKSTLPKKEQTAAYCAH
jgi:hypothetical protein